MRRPRRRVGYLVDRCDAVAAVAQPVGEAAGRGPESSRARAFGLSRLAAALARLPKDLAQDRLGVIEGPWVIEQ